jgi:hypothetical protein
MMSKILSGVVVTRTARYGNPKISAAWKSGMGYSDPGD